MPKPETREEILDRIRLGEDSAQQSRIIRFDEQIVPDATVRDLEPARWQRLATERTLDDEVTFLQKLGIARADSAGEVRRPWPVF
ncbi:MAG TPA: hypothetical protein VEZ11_06635 [Thermoanaerobaculia bacterium]|nr:hypothetical protein [Thermoanaerobaculia bacterium]